MIRLTDQEFQHICQFMSSEYGINLTKKRVLIEYRLMNTLNKYGVTNFKDYFQILFKDKSGKMIEEFVNKITTNYTYFMREEAHFEFIVKNILPQLDPQRRFQIWIAGCSSGQECYTLAMYLEDYRRKGYLLPPIDIIGSDISMKVLEMAKKAEYPIEAIERIPAKWRLHYCVIAPDGKTFQIRNIIKNQIKFRAHNLMEPFAKRTFDLIMCRNVLIYFDEPSRKQIYHHFAQSLKPKGYLILGHAEMVTQGNEDFNYLRSSIYRLKGT